MTHPDETTLHQWLDGELSPGPHRSDVEAHLEGCERCAAVVSGARNLGRGLNLWAEDVGVPLDDLADLVRRAVPERSPTEEAPGTPPASPPAASPSSAPQETGKVVPLRRWLFPALAAAAALVVALSGQSPGDRGSPRHLGAPLDASPAPGVEVASVSSVDVVSVDVVGAKSYAVMEIPGSRPGSTSAVVWIQDEPDDPASEPSGVTVQ